MSEVGHGDYSGEKPVPAVCFTADQGNFEEAHTGKQREVSP